MFDDQNQKNNQEPEDMLADTSTNESQQQSQVQPAQRPPASQISSPQQKVSPGLGSKLNQPSQDQSTRMGNQAMSQNQELKRMESELLGEDGNNNDSSKIKNILIIALVVIIIVGGGYWVYANYGGKLGLKKETEVIDTSEVNSSNDVQNQTPQDEIAPEINQEIIVEEVESIEPKDSDNDGLTDEQEERLGTDPNDIDTDSDGLIDKIEVNVYKTDPLNPDTDGDGYNDGEEVRNKYDPNDATPGKSLFDYEEENNKVNNDLK